MISVFINNKIINYLISVTLTILFFNYQKKSILKPIFYYSMNNIFIENLCFY